MSKKIYITESQLKSLIESKNKKKKKDDLLMTTVKANRKARREEAREIYGDGFKATTRVAKSDKVYSRKGKNRFVNNNFNED